MAAAGIKDFESLRSFLKERNPFDGIAIAGRAVTRMLPVVVSVATRKGGENSTERIEALMSVLFRATALAHLAGKYPHHINMLSEAAKLTAAAADEVAGDARPAASLSRTVFVAAYPTAETAAHAAETLENAATFLARANLPVLGEHYQVGVPYQELHDEAYRAAWQQINADISQVIRNSAEDLTAAPLWLRNGPNWVPNNFAALLQAMPRDEHWRVWIGWYSERLAGRSRSEDYDLVFASVPQIVWTEGAASANAWIKAKLDKLRLAPFANRPGAIEPEINVAGKLDVARRPPMLAYPNDRSERDRLALQSFCQTQASRLLEALRQQKFGNFRDADFADLLAFYLVDLPIQGREGTFLLADAQAGELRDLAEDLAPVLPSRFARGLREILAKHDELRACYVEIPNVDKAASQSQKLPPPPPAPLLRLQAALQSASPESVTPELVEQTKQVLRAAPTIELDEDDRRRAASPDIVHQSPRPAGAPSARQRHAHNVATLLAKLNRLGGVCNLKDGVASVGALHNVDKFITEDLPALIAEILKHWPF